MWSGEQHRQLQPWAYSSAVNAAPIVPPTVRTSGRFNHSHRGSSPACGAGHLRADETGADDHYPRSRPQCFAEGERVGEATQRVHIRQAWHTGQLTGRRAGGDDRAGVADLRPPAARQRSPVWSAATSVTCRSSRIDASQQGSLGAASVVRYSLEVFRGADPAPLTGTPQTASNATRIAGMLGHIKMPSHTTRPIKRRRLSVWAVYVSGVDIDDVDPIVFQQSGGNLRSDRHAYQRPDRCQIRLILPAGAV
jgi:hypothetical protein